MKRLICSLMFFLITPSHAEVVDGIAAIVGERIITISEVVAEARIKEVLRSNSGTVALPIKVAYSMKILDQMINRELVYQEATRLKKFAEGIDIFEEMLAFEEKFTDTADFHLFLEREGLKVDGLAERLSAEKIASAFVAERLALMSTVNAREIEEQYNDNINLYSDRGLKDIEGEIREMLSRKKADAFLDKWLADLRVRDKVKYFRLPQSLPPL